MVRVFFEKLSNLAGWDGFRYRQATPSNGREGFSKALESLLNRLVRAAKGMETV